MRRNVCGFIIISGKLGQNLMAFGLATVHQNNRLLYDLVFNIKEMQQ